MTSQKRIGPSEQKLRDMNAGYYGTQAAIESLLAAEKFSSKAQGIVFSSPLVFGSADEYYDFNLDYYKVVREKRFGMPSNFPTFLADYKDVWSDNPIPFFSIPDISDNRLYSSQGGNPKFDTRNPERKDLVFLDDGKKSPFARREMNVKTRTFAGGAGDFTIASDFRQSNKPKRPGSNEISNDVIASVVRTINGDRSGQGLFSAMLPGAPNGFLISEAHDFDTLWNGEINDDIEKNRLKTTYWSERLGSNHPLRDLYEKFYGKGARFWSSGRDRFPIAVSSGTTLTSNNSFGIGKRISYNFKSLPTVETVFVGGPFSHTDIKLGNGSNIFLASPAMTAAFHRNTRLNNYSAIFDGRRIDEFHADTVLYPSSVGQYASNTLDIGDGNSVVYYDSSFSDIKVGRGNNIFLPSFGAFNWSIDWIPAFGTRITNGFEKNPWGSTSNLDKNWLVNDPSGKPLISPIPWDSIIYDPVTGKPVNGKSYFETNSEFAAAPNRDKINNLYTINTLRQGDRLVENRQVPGILDYITSGKFESDKFQRTYFNGKQLQTEASLASYNPVHQLGGSFISAKGGSNTFYGMDWSFWRHLLPSVGTTTANLRAGEINTIKRAAQHRWNTVTFAGGEGSNTFNLGNVIDNITNNGLFYKAESSYDISLTHEKIYRPDEIKKFGGRFGNMFNLSSGQLLGSVVNLQLQADPGTVSLTVQDAEKGAKATEGDNAWWGITQQLYNMLPEAADVSGLQKDNARLVADSTRSANGPTASLITSNLTLLGKLLAPVGFIQNAISTYDTFKGIYNLLNSPEVKPPQEEVKATYLSGGLDLAKKAVVINDWNPAARINIQLPSVNASQWNALTFELKRPNPDSSRNTSIGAFLNLNKSTINNDGITAQRDFPLVVLENLDTNNSINNGFGYYSYSFVEPDGSGPLRAGYTPISSSNLRLFGQLPDPSKILGDKNEKLNPTIFPQKFRDGSDYIYKSDDGFDMRFDAANYDAFFNNQGNSAGNFYTRYYFNTSSIRPSQMPTGWNINENLKQNTSTVSLEFDSRTLGWYWQPVFKLDQGNGKTVNTKDLNLKNNSLDFFRSKLWVKDQLSGSWSSHNYYDLNFITRAYRAAQKATTFYSSSLNEQTKIEIQNRQEKDQQLGLLESFLPDLRDLVQPAGFFGNRGRFRLTSLGQIQSVSKKSDGVLLVVYNSVDDFKDEPAVRAIRIFRDNDNQIKAYPDAVPIASKALAFSAKNDAMKQVPNELTEVKSMFTPNSNRASRDLAAPFEVEPQSFVIVPTDGDDNIISANEIINGVPKSSNVLGSGSLDVLTGGRGRDLFVLGNEQGFFYQDYAPGMGYKSLAVISDFSGADRIQLHGSINDYRLVRGNAGVYIQSRIPTDDAIGFVQGATLASLRLDDASQFVYV